MGRVATQDTQVCGADVAEDSRISLCWASANRDERTFERPNEVVLDRKLNPHVAFGFGTHNCLGATHARMLLKILIQHLAKSSYKMNIISVEENIETVGGFKRKVGFNELNIKFSS